MPKSKWNLNAAYISERLQKGCFSPRATSEPRESSLPRCFCKIPNLWLMVITKNPPYNVCMVDYLFIKEGKQWSERKLAAIES